MPLFLHQNGGYFIMTETVTKKIPTINAVEGFDPAEFTRQLPNEDGSTSLYLDVKYRLLVVPATPAPGQDCAGHRPC